MRAQQARAAILGHHRPSVSRCMKRCDRAQSGDFGVLKQRARKSPPRYQYEQLVWGNLGCRLLYCGDHLKQEVVGCLPRQKEATNEERNHKECGHVGRRHTSVGRGRIALPETTPLWSRSSRRLHAEKTRLPGSSSFMGPLKCLFLRRSPARPERAVRNSLRVARANFAHTNEMSHEDLLYFLRHVLCAPLQQLANASWAAWFRG